MLDFVVHNLTYKFSAFFFFNDTATTEIYTRIARRQRQMCIRDRLEKLQREYVLDFVEPKELKERFLTDDFSFESDKSCLLYTSPSPRDRTRSRMPSSA